MAWLELEDENQLEHVHQMQIAAEVRKVFQYLGGEGDKPTPVKLDDFRIKSQKKRAPKKVSKRKSKKRLPTLTADQVAKMRWFAAVGGNVTTKNPDGTYTLPDGRTISEAELNAKGTKGANGNRA